MSKYGMVDSAFLIDFKCNERFEENSIQDCKFLQRLPVDYLALLKQFNGGEGLVGEEYLVLHSIEELEAINNDLKISDIDPKIIIVGGNGGGEFVGIDINKAQHKYILLPFIFEHDSIIDLSDSAVGLFQRLYTKGYF